jgi:Regulator of cell morphogenesis and NO signaling
LSAQPTTRTAPADHTSDPLIRHRRAIEHHLHQEVTMLPTPIETATIGAIVAADYRTAKVFEARGIDFCCGGKTPAGNGLRPERARSGAHHAELEAVQHEPGNRSENYGAWSLSFLADYIVNTHHVYLRENDDQIAAYARKIAGGAWRQPSRGDRDSRSLRQDRR